MTKPVLRPKNQVSEAERDCRKVECSHCGAGPGERCKSETGQPRSYSHTRRYFDAKEAR